MWTWSLIQWEKKHQEEGSPAPKDCPWDVGHSSPTPDRCRDTWKKGENNPSTTQQPRLWLVCPVFCSVCWRCFANFCLLGCEWSHLLFHAANAFKPCACLQHSNFIKVNVPNSVPHSQVQIHAAIELLILESTLIMYNHVTCHVVPANGCHTNNKSSHGF